MYFGRINFIFNVATPKALRSGPTQEVTNSLETGKKKSRQQRRDGPSVDGRFFGTSLRRPRQVIGRLSSPPRKDEAALRFTLRCTVVRYAALYISAVALSMPWHWCQMH